MKFFETIELFMRLDGLIRRRQTGSPEELAMKLGVSRATVSRYLTEMKDRGFPIYYSLAKRSYCYQGKVSVRFEFDVIQTDLHNKVKGGKNMSIISFFEIRKVYFNRNEWPSPGLSTLFSTEGISEPLK